MKRILVRAPNWIGDQILAYPFYRQLRARYPSAWIGVVCTDWVQDIQFRGFVDEVLVLPKSRGDSGLTSFFKLRKFSRDLLKRGPWDLGITLPNSFGSALLLKWAKVKARRGYAADARSFLLTEALPLERTPTLHRSQAYLNLLAPEGLPPFLAMDYWTEGEENDFDPHKHWPEVIPMEPPFEPYFVVAPGSNAESRKWNVQKFSSFIKTMTEKYLLKGVIVGGGAEAAIAARFLREGLPVLDYTGKGSVASHWKLFRGASFTLSNDSGLAHVAALCGSRVQIIWGAGDPRRTRPIGPGAVQVRSNPVECWPCERNVCSFEGNRHNQCLMGITPEKIREEIEHGFLME